MVWAFFGGFYSLSKLIVMERYEESPKIGYSARSYLQALEEAMPDMGAWPALHARQRACPHGKGGASVV